MQDELVINVSKVNKLSLNLTKTKWTLSHSQKKKRLIANDLPILYINNFEIIRKSVTKLLGIYIDENLTWKYYIEHVCNKVLKSIEIMYKSRNILSKSLMKQLYFSFTSMKILHGPALTNQIQFIFIAIKNMQLGLFMTRSVLHTKPLLKHEKASTTYKINLFQLLSWIFKCKNRTAPFVFHNLYTIKPPSR